MRAARSLPVLGLLLVVLSACGGGEDETSALVELTATPIEGPSSEVPSPVPSFTPSPAPWPSPSASPTPRPASDADRARFAAQYRPENASDLEFVAVNVDREDDKELVFVYVDAQEGRVQLDIAWWDGFVYAIGASSPGGPAFRVDRLRVGDVNLDDRTEIATFQSGRERSSLSLWQVPEPGRLVELRAVGGCADGSHVYGAVGAELRDRDDDGRKEIEATCNEAPLPVSEWRTDRYVWERGAYRFVAPPEPSPSPTPSPTPAPSPSPPDEDDEPEDD